jgi:hypothetical protein
MHEDRAGIFLKGKSTAQKTSMHYFRTRQDVQGFGFEVTPTPAALNYSLDTRSVPDVLARSEYTLIDIRLAVQRVEGLHQASLRHEAVMA